MQPEYWTYEADSHCIYCAGRRFGDALQDGRPLDREGNEVHPAFSTDEGPLDVEGNPVGVWCGTCGGIIRDPSPEAQALSDRREYSGDGDTTRDDDPDMVDSEKPAILYGKPVTLIAAIAMEVERSTSLEDRAESFGWSADHFAKIEDEIADCLDALQDMLPSGSGIDSGSKILADESKPNAIKIAADFHHMDEVGSYDGWTDHVLTFRPSFVNGHAITVSGRNRNEIKDYLFEAFDLAVRVMVRKAHNPATGWTWYEAAPEGETV